MAFFNPAEISALVKEGDIPTDTLDLRGCTLAVASRRLEQRLAAKASQAASKLRILIDPATATSGETLFLPLGRQLLAARQSGRVRRFALLPHTAGAGFYVELNDE
jgi:hypothetical protein